MDWHGNLPKEKIDQIIFKIPNINYERFRLAVDINYSLSITDHLNNTNLIGAIECLDDARKRYSQIQYSLYEALTCVIWNQEFAIQPCEENSIFTGEYYLSYATLLMYAAAEDIASFIVHFMNISAEIKTYFDSEKGKRKLKRIIFPSDHVKVGVFLRENYEGYSITNICLKLKDNNDWNKALERRNAWVHEKPPSIKGSSVEFTREKNVIVDANGNNVMVLKAPPQDYSIDDLCNIVLNATKALAITLAELAEIVINEKEVLKNTFIQPSEDQP
ncbi:MAG: hypothetical protein MUO64_07190 [Anaerolineales bacterium]|nr:hypothetical protein [Anaerolineales bacterium]